MKSRIYVLILLLAAISSNSWAQRYLKATLAIDGETKHVSYLVRHGTAYASSKELTLALGGYFYFNSTAIKLEMKFPNYKLKVTGANQFIVLTSKSDNKHTTYQLPISTRIGREDVFIPINYTLPYISKAIGKELIYNNGAKHFTVTSKDYPTENQPEVKPPVVKIEPKKPSPPPVNSPYDIYDLNIEEKSNGTLVKLKATRKINKFSSSIKENILYLFLSGVTIKPGIIKDIKTAGLIRNVKLVKVKGNYQFEFPLKEGYSNSESFQDQHNNDMLITIHNKLLASQEDHTEDVNKWLFDAVVIDAGHGGKDGGAVGVTGILEKNTNLGIALNLGKLIEKNMKDVKVIYTRKSDKFVELYRRGKIANEAGGKLFISIHGNSLEKKPSSINGYEIYLLRPGRTQEAINIAEYENSVIKYEDNPDMYQKLTDENFILVSMAHSSYMRYSEKFSDELNEQLKKNTSLSSRGVRQAGFFVLVGASMPGVLIETGYLSNRSNEAYLNSKAGQRNIAKSIFNAIKSYRNYYEEMIKEESE